MLLIVVCAATLFLSVGCDSEEKTEEENVPTISGTDGSILLSAVRKDSKVDVTVRLTKNCGINQMVLELIYNTKVMTLTGLDEGPALGGLGLTTTNTKTEKGYAITPFRFVYMNNSNSNDSSTGVMFVLHFSVKKDAGRSSTAVGLTYQRGDINSYAASRLVSRAFAITPVTISLS